MVTLGPDRPARDKLGVGITHELMLMHQRVAGGLEHARKLEIIKQNNSL